MDYLMTKPLKEQKSILRREKLQARKAIFPEYAYEAAVAVANFITSTKRYKECKNVLLYANYSTEFRTDILFMMMQQQKKNIFYPKVEEDELFYCRVDALEQLNDGYKGIPEPYGVKADLNDPFESIVIVPGCVFGKNGYRIGYGKGFYDRFLIKHPELYKIGLCYDVQVVDKCPHEPHDIKMNEIITERQDIYIY